MAKELTEEQKEAYKVGYKDFFAGQFEYEGEHTELYELGWEYAQNKMLAKVTGGA